RRARDASDGVGRLQVSLGDWSAYPPIKGRPHPVLRQESPAPTTPREFGAGTHGPIWDYRAGAATAVAAGDWDALFGLGCHGRQVSYQDSKAWPWLGYRKAERNERRLVPPKAQPRGANGGGRGPGTSIR